MEVDNAQRMRKAIIDLGTNTFNLLIADVEGVEFTIVESRKKGVALGMGGINEKKIAPDAEQRGLDALKEYVEVCKEHKVSNVFAFGTSAMRDAKNGADFVAKIKEQTGLEVEVIGGKREAELICKGVQLLPDCPENAMILDIGGGSSEVLILEDGKNTWGHSFDIGVSRLFQLLEPQDPITKQDEEKIIAYLEKHCVGIPEKKYAKLIGSSGSFETLWEMIHEAHFRKVDKFYRLRVRDVLEEIENIKRSTLAERERNPFIMPIRRTMLPLTAVKIQWFIHRFGVEEILVSPYSMKEGALME